MCIARRPEETKMPACNVDDRALLCLPISFIYVVESANISPERLHFIQDLICKFQNNGLMYCWKILPPLDN